MLPADSGVARRDANCSRRLDGHEHDPSGDDAGESDGDDGDQDRDNHQDHVKEVGYR